MLVLQNSLFGFYFSITLFCFMLLIIYSFFFRCIEGYIGYICSFVFTEIILHVVMSFTRSVILDKNAAHPSVLSTEAISTSTDL